MVGSAEFFESNCCERAGREGEEVGADRAGLGECECVSLADRRGIADDGPCGRMVEIEGESGLQVGLVEAWKGHAGIHGDEQSVKVFAAVVLVFVARDGLAGGSGVAGERESEGVLTGDHGKIQMAVLQLCRDRLAIQRG